MTFLKLPLPPLLHLSLSISSSLLLVFFPSLPLSPSLSRRETMHLALITTPTMKGSIDYSKAWQERAEIMLSKIFLLPSPVNNQSRHRYASTRPLREPEEEAQTTVSTEEKGPLGKVGFKIRNVSLLLSRFDQGISEGSRVWVYFRTTWFIFRTTGKGGEVERIDCPPKTLSEPKMSAKLGNKVQRNSHFLAGFQCQDSFQSSCN